MAAMGLGQLQLGAHAIGAGHQQGLAQACWQAAEATESPQTAQHFWATGGLHAGANALHKGATGHHVNAGCAVIHAPKATICLDPAPAATPKAHNRTPRRWTKPRSAHFPISGAYCRDHSC